MSIITCYWWCLIIVLECDKGSFGIGCKESCGHCQDENQCSITKGTCLTGCAAGYKGDSCKSRKYTMTRYMLKWLHIIYKCTKLNHTI